MITIQGELLVTLLESLLFAQAKPLSKLQRYFLIRVPIYAIDIIILNVLTMVFLILAYVRQHLLPV